MEESVDVDHVNPLSLHVSSLILLMSLLSRHKACNEGATTGMDGEDASTLMEFPISNLFTFNSCDAPAAHSACAGHAALRMYES